jgi:DNA-binding response OmpR family regulator
LVLVADDDELLQQLVSHKLVQRGYEVRCVDTGEALENALQEVLPDAIVLDAMMPIVDGFEALRRLRSTPATARVPVIMLTARRGEDDVVTALSLGANDYLSKPFLPEELALRVSRLIAGGNA